MRKPRYISVGAEYHVTALINRGEFALESNEIKELFLHIVRRAKKKYSFKLQNFIIMDNHIHLLIKPGRDESLSGIMQWILGVFAKRFNKHFNLKGHVWYDRFKSNVIDSFQQLIATFRYICNNPVKAKMIENPEEYLYGALWFIRHRRFDLVEPPDLFILAALPDLFEQLLITD
ncbi:MAG: transposase [Spirochaetales bacterium]|nr:transposase [Spirochaetales bacterium]